MPFPPFPMPNDHIFDRTVIASTWITDELILVLLLNKQEPFFTVAQLIGNDNAENSDTWKIVASQDHMNIVPAINGDTFPNRDGYVDMGGDY